jgi:hypothetical protein
LPLDLTFDAPERPATGLFGQLQKVQFDTTHFGVAGKDRVSQATKEKFAANRDECNLKANENWARIRSERRTLHSFSRP